MASQNGHTPSVKLLLEYGAELDVASNKGVTALMLASLNGHTEIVKLLCEWGSDVNISALLDNVEYTALKVAKDAGRKDIVGILESTGAQG
jgi:ankyrin repeat protein